MKKRTRKLTLHRETIRILGGHELSPVVGASGNELVTGCPCTEGCFQTCGCGGGTANTCQQHTCNNCSGAHTCECP